MSLNVLLSFSFDLSDYSLLLFLGSSLALVGVYWNILSSLIPFTGYEATLPPLSFGSSFFSE